MSGWRLSFRFAVHRRRPLMLCALIVCVMVGASAAWATVLRSSEAAIAQSIHAEHAGAAFSLQVKDPSILPKVGMVEGLTAVQDGRTSVRVRDDAVAPADLRVVDREAALGVLDSGRHPRTKAEVTLTTYLARALGVALGDEVTFEHGHRRSQVAARVVGLTQDPADSQAATLVALDPDLLTETATVFLSESDPYADQTLQPLLDERSVAMRTTERLAAERGASGIPEKLSRTRSLPAAISLALVCILGGLWLASSRSFGRDVGGLVATGLPVGAASMVVVRACLGTVIGSTVLGVVAGIASVALGRGPISHSLGQDWTGTVVPTSSLLLTSGILLLALVLTVPFRRVVRVLAGVGPHKPGIPALVWAGVLAAGVAMLVASSTRTLNPQLAPVGGLMTAIAVAPFSQHLLARWIRGRAYRRTAAVMARSLLPVSLIAASLVFATAYYPAVIQHNAAAAAPLDSAPQPRGSFLVYEVPSDAALLVVDEYQELGGKQVDRYFLPRERTQMWRATSTKLLRCMERDETNDPHQLPQDCYPHQASSPINVTLLVAEGLTRADPGLLVDAEVGLLRFPTGSSTVDRLARTRAIPDDRLGGNLPGVVVAEGSPTARRMGLERSDSELVAFYDFSALEPADQAHLRAVVSRVAPASQVSELDVGEDDRTVSLSVLVAWLGAAAMWLVVLPVGLALVVSHRRTRRVLVDLGSVRAWRRMIAWLWVLPLGMTIATAGLLGRWAAWTAGVHLPGGFGWSWTASTVAGIAVVIVLQRAFLAVPSRTTAE